MERTIKIVVSEKKTQDGRSFNTYKTPTKNGRMMDVKFRKTVKNIPDKNCFIVVDPAKTSEDRTKEFPCLWIEEVIEIKETMRNPEANINRFNELFGEED